MNELFKLFDSYSWIARVSPAVVTLLPGLLTVSLILGFGDIPRLLGSIIVSFATATLLANVARSRGKTIEPTLLQKWGGWPSTTMLRHRDGRINAPTKGRYHAELQRLCTGITLPSPEDEARDPVGADRTYRSATMRLIEARRDEKYALLHRDNASYGFRRNLLGLKPIALVAIAVTTAITSGALFVNMQTISTIHDILVDVSVRSPIYAAIAINLMAAVAWLIVVRDSFVCQAAEEYAFALLRTLEV